AAIVQYRWPGNVRELANVMERVALMTETAVVAPADLGLPDSSERSVTDADGPTVVTTGFTDSLHRFERAQLIGALEATGWNVVRAARQLGLPRTTLRHRMAKYRMTRTGEPPSLPAGHRDAPKQPSLAPAVPRRDRTVTLLRARFARVTLGAMEVL